MAKVRCPECDRSTSIPEGKTSTRCPHCDCKIRLDSPEDEQADDRILTRKKKNAPPHVLLSLWPLWFLIPLVGIACVSPFHPSIGANGLCFGLAIAIAGSIIAYVIARRERLITQDNLDPTLRVISGLMPIVNMLFIISWAIQRPLKIGPWVVVSLVAFISAIVCGIMMERTKHVPENNLHVQGFKQPPQGNNNLNPWGGIPKGDPPRNNNPGEIKPKENVPPALDGLLNDLGSQDVFARKKAYAELARIQPIERRQEVADKLLDAVARNDPFAKQEAMNALAVWATPDQIPRLIEMTSHKDIGMRQCAIQTLGAIPDSRCHKPVANGLRDLFTRTEAQVALRRLGPPAEKEVLAFVHDKDFGIQRAAVEVLKDIGTPESIPALQALVKANNVFVRRSAEEAIKSIQARAGK